MICPYCKEEIAEGAIKCKHCGSMLDNKDKAKLQNTATQPDVDIDTLPVSETFRKRFHLIKENYKGKRFGLPYYEKLSLRERRKLDNWWAFFFSIIYYLIKGMWRKAIVLFAIQLVLVLFVSFLVPFAYQELSFKIVCAIVPIIACCNANYDLYRKYVLKQTYWW